VIVNTIAATAVIVVLMAGYALIGPALSTSPGEASAMVSEAEDNAVQPPVATGGQQGIPSVESTGGGGVERGRVAQGLAVVAVGEQLAAAEREVDLGHEPEGRENEATARSEQDHRPRAAERERPQAEHAAALRAEQTCRRGSLGCGGNHPAAVTLREEPKTKPSTEAPRAATLARRGAPAPPQAAPNLLRRCGGGHQRHPPTLLSVGRCMRDRTSRLALPAYGRIDRSAALILSSATGPKFFSPSALSGTAPLRGDRRRGAPPSAQPGWSCGRFRRDKPQ
jgi:hypothetical protein